MTRKINQVPSYAVIFTSTLKSKDPEYLHAAERMLELARTQEGFIGFESARENLGISISYWEDLDSIKRWKNNSEHKLIQEKGIKDWYAYYRTRIAIVEKDYQFIEQNKE